MDNYNKLQQTIHEFVSTMSVSDIEKLMTEIDNDDYTYAWHIIKNTFGNVLGNNIDLGMIREIYPYIIKKLLNLPELN
jgi:hypothetical protein